MGLRNKANLYIIVCIVYLLVTILLGKINIISRLLSYIIRFWSLAILFYVLVGKRKMPALLKWFVVLIVLFTAYGIAEIVQGKYYFAHDPPIKVTGYMYIRYIYESLLPIFVFYYYTVKGYIDRSFINRWLYPLLLVLTFFSVIYGINVSEAIGNEEVTNNSGYDFLSFIPLLMFCPSRSRKQLVCLGYCLLAILLCMKRGAIIISVIVLAIFFLYLMKSGSRKAKVRVFLLCVLVTGFFAFAVNYMMAGSDYFQERVEKTTEGDSSGRDVYYAFFLDYYLNHTTEEEFLIGMGADATLGIWDNYAHNDWLEIAINQGMLGLVLYLLFWLVFLRSCFRKGVDSDVKVALWMLFVIYFLKTIFSMSYRDFTLYSSLAIGFCLAQLPLLDKSIKNTIE